MVILIKIELQKFNLVTILENRIELSKNFLKAEMLMQGVLKKAFDGKLLQINFMIVFHTIILILTTL